MDHDRHIEREDVALTIGRELLQATSGGLDLDMDHKHDPIEGMKHIDVLLFTKNLRVDPALMEVLAEREYGLQYRGEDPDRLGKRHKWKLQIPGEVVDTFERYVDVRGDPHPAPPKRRVAGGEACDYDEAEGVPHPKIDFEGFRRKIDEIRDG